jgi:hypothetical protein
LKKGDLILLRNQTGGTGVSPVQAQAKACGYKNSSLNATRDLCQKPFLSS